MQTNSQIQIISNLSPGERKAIGNVLERIAVNDFEGMVLEKLKQRNDIFRIRNGGMRLLYRDENGKISILALERRKDNQQK